MCTISVYIYTYIVYIIERTAESREDKERQKDREGGEGEREDSRRSSEKRGIPSRAMPSS